MLEGAGSCLAELLQQILTRVRQFDERHIGGKSEGLLDEIHERISEEQQHTVHHQVFVHAVIHLQDTVVLHQLQGKVHSATGYCYKDGRLEQLGALTQFVQ